MNLVFVQQIVLIISIVSVWKFRTTNWIQMIQRIIRICYGVEKVKPTTRSSKMTILMSIAEKLIFTQGNIIIFWFWSLGVEIWKVYFGVWRVCVCLRALSLLLKYPCPLSASILHLYFTFFVAVKRPSRRFVRRCQNIRFMLIIWQKWQNRLLWRTYASL